MHLGTLKRLPTSEWLSSQSLPLLYHWTVRLKMLCLGFWLRLDWRLCKALWGQGCHCLHIPSCPRSTQTTQPWKGLSTAREQEQVSLMPCQEDAGSRRTWQQWEWQVSAPQGSCEHQRTRLALEQPWWVFLKCFLGISSLRESWNTQFHFLFNYTLNFKKPLQSFLPKYRELGILFLGAPIHLLRASVFP